MENTAASSGDGPRFFRHLPAEWRGERNDAGATMPTQGTFAPGVIEQLRTIINPVRERFGFRFTMERWADEVRRNRRQFAVQTRNKPRRGRPYDDPGRFAALLLAVIFEEYTGKRPARTTREAETDTKLRDKDSPFYKFCRAACDAAGNDTSDNAFREAIAELSGRRTWEANVPALRILLWGELRMTDADYEQVRSRFFMALTLSQKESPYPILSRLDRPNKQLSVH